MARHFKVDGVILSSPNNGFNVSLEDISSSDSGRNLSGTMDKKVIAQKWTVELSYTNISDEIISSILQKVKSNVEVDLTFPSPMLGTDDTQKFYTGTPSITHKNTINDKCFWDLKLKFVQV